MEHVNISFMLGHWGKRSRPNDRGVSSNGYVEAYENLKLMADVAIAIEEKTNKAIRVQLLCDGNYSERAQRSNQIGSKLFIAWHLNYTPGGNYTLVIYDHRNSSNVGFARELATAIGKVLNIPANVWSSWDPSKQKPRRGFNNIKHVNAPAFILETCFIDNPVHMKRLKQNYDSLVDAIANTIINYINP